MLCILLIFSSILFFFETESSLTLPTSKGSGWKTRHKDYPVSVFPMQAHASTIYMYIYMYIVCICICIYPHEVSVLDMYIIFTYIEKRTKCLITSITYCEHQKTIHSLNLILYLLHHNPYVFHYYKHILKSSELSGWQRYIGKLLIFNISLSGKP